MWILKKGTDELIYRAEEDSQIKGGKKQSYVYQGLRAGRNKLGDWY